MFFEGVLEEINHLQKDNGTRLHSPKEPTFSKSQRPRRMVLGRWESVFGIEGLYLVETEWYLGMINR